MSTAILLTKERRYCFFDKELHIQMQSKRFKINLPLAEKSQNITATRFTVWGKKYPLKLFAIFRASA